MSKALCIGRGCMLPAMLTTSLHRCGTSKAWNGIQLRSRTDDNSFRYT
jgi:hypothetical protein